MAPDPPERAARPRRRWWHRGPFARREVRWSVGFVVLFLFAFYVVVPLVASHRAELENLGHVNAGYLVAGVALEVAALVAYAQLTYAVLPTPGTSRERLFRINLSTLALSHVSPGGTAPGAALGYRLLTQSGISGADAGFTLGTQGIGSAVVLNVLFWLALVAFLVEHGFHPPAGQGSAASTSASILVAVAAAIGVVLLAAFGGIFALLTRGQERAATAVHRVSARLRFVDADRVTAFLERLAERFAVLLEDRRLLVRATAWATTNWLLDAASLWIFVAAFGRVISPVDLLVAYGLANILAAIPVTPGGLGVVEFVLASLITGFGPSAAEALSAVLAYRAVNFWLPIPVGGLAYASLQLEHGDVYRRLHLYFLGRYQRRPAARIAPDVPPSPAAPSRGGAREPRAGAARTPLRRRAVADQDGAARRSPNRRPRARRGPAAAGQATPPPLPRRQRRAG